MKPIEVMAKAYDADLLSYMMGHDAISGKWRVWKGGAVVAEEDSAEAASLRLCQVRQLSGLRNALLALADAELLEDVLRAGEHAVDVPTVIHIEDAALVFRAMLRKIANDAGE